jgi:NAD(P)-dependent dehydrogenase (short-subunit alcohol dehydrogenase family)
LWEVDPEVWWTSQALHIRAPQLFIRALVPAMVAQRRGRVIIVSAVASRMVAPYLSAYCVGKLAQVRLVEELAAETRERGVSAFAIDPGFVFTAIAQETMTSPDALRWLPDGRAVGEATGAGRRCGPGALRAALCGPGLRALRRCRGNTWSWVLTWKR